MTIDRWSVTRCVALAASSALGLDAYADAIFGEQCAFALPTVEPDARSERASSSKRSDEKRERERKEAKKELERTSLGRLVVRFKDVRGRALAGDLDLIAFYFGVSALGALGAFVERIVRARSEISDALTPTLAAFGIGIAMRALWRAHTDARVTPSSEKTVAMLFAFVAWCASTLFVLLAPVGVRDFKLASVANAVNEVLVDNLRGRPQASLEVVGVTFGLLGAAVAGLSLAATVRVTKSYLIFTTIPEWAASYAGSSAVSHWRRFVVHTALALPVLAVVAGSPAMVSEPLGLLDTTTRDIQCVMFVIAGTFMMASVNPLTQAHLDSGLIAWYEVKEGNDDGVLSERAVAVVTRKLDVTNHLVCKVALQVAAPALFIFSCGLGGLTATTFTSEMFVILGWFSAAWSVVVGIFTVVASQPEVVFATR